METKLNYSVIQNFIDEKMSEPITCVFDTTRKTSIIYFPKDELYRVNFDTNYEFFKNLKEAVDWYNQL